MWSHLLSLSVFAVWCVDHSRGTLYTGADELPKQTYDFVIVGAGAAGNVLARRLSENSTHSVLVIEAGVSNEGVVDSIVPYLSADLTPYSPYTWNYTTVPQSGLDNRTVSYARGRMLGGSSSINLMCYTRGSNDDYDRWANVTNDDVWAWENLEPYYLKSSRLVPSQDGHDTTGQVDPFTHGYGPIEVSLPNYPYEIESKVNASTSSRGSEFPFILDMNAGNAVGIGYKQSTIGGGERSSSAVAYLDPVLSRSNLDVLIQHQVTKLLSDGADGDGVRFNQVEFAANASADRRTVTAAKEIIVSAGAVASPQLLMLSGIGNKTALESLNIESVIDLPDVGQHLTDHPYLTNYFSVNSNFTDDAISRNATLAEEYLALWNQTRTGPFSGTRTTNLGFLRLPPNASIFENFSDPSAGPLSGHYEFLFGDGFTPSANSTEPTEGFYMTISVVVVSPLSRGSVTLNSTNPFDFPVIDPAFLTSLFDQAVLLAAVRSLRRFVEQSPWEGYIIQRYGVVGEADSDEEILAAARTQAITTYHPVGTVRMSPLDANWGVVDSRLRVKGAKSLRVVDASIFPFITASHTVAPTYIIAERAADFILEEWPDDKWH